MADHTPWHLLCRDSETVAAIGETALVSDICAVCRATCATTPSILYGPGDDAAVWTLPPHVCAVTTADALVCHRHFLPEDDPYRVGWKALTVNISDVAAMGGVPHHAVINLVIPSSTTHAYIMALFAGMSAAADAYACALVGGDVVGGNECVISVAMTGVCTHEPVFRHGARRGDALMVTGALGGAQKSGRHLDVTPRVSVASWLCAHARPTAMMDLSDGLAMDARRLAQASNVAVHIDSAKIPIHDGYTQDNALYDGEDFELLFTLPSTTDSVAIATACGEETGCACTPIGSIASPPVDVTIDGKSLPPRGYAHFAQ